MLFPSNNMGNEETRQAIATLVETLRRTYTESLHSPFPYAGCRKVLNEAENKAKKEIKKRLRTIHEGFIPDLDLYQSNIAGYCSNARKLSLFAEDNLLLARTSLEQSFFGQHPDYSDLIPLITPENVPDLYQQMTISEEVRHDLLRLIALVTELSADHEATSHEEGTEETLVL